MTVLEQEEEWTKVLTADGYIGYMKSKKLSDSYEEQVTSDFRAAEYTSIHKDYDMNLLWHQVTSQDSNDALAADIQDVKGQCHFTDLVFYQQQRWRYFFSCKQ